MTIELLLVYLEGKEILKYFLGRKWLWVMTHVQDVVG